MINVYKALLSEAVAEKLTYSDLFKCGAGVQSNMSKTGYTVASVSQSRKLVFSELQAIKNSTNLPLTLSYPNRDTKSYSSKLEAVTDLEANLATYYPDI